MSNAELRELEERIVGDFAKLVEAGVGQLQVLVEGVGAVRVLPWDWFHAELEEHPSLSFRWFRGLPPGVELFGDQSGAEATFRDFLNSGQLRYFSRDEYARHGIGRVDRGEAELVAQLAGKDGAALLITGPGGVGKTRLSWELAEELSRPDPGFDVYRLGRSAGFESVTQLAAYYPEPASILLLVDYAEAAPRLAEIADAIEHVASNSGHRLRLVATCRASAVNQVKDAVSVLPLEEKSLRSVRTGEEEYAQWVTRSILSLEPMPEPAAIERVCRGVPALAAFAVFLFRQHRRQFDAQFGALHGLDDFENWASHRIAALTARFGGDASIGRTLARVALDLPLPAEAFEAIEAESPLNRSLLRALIDDCWIEREDDCYIAAHDVLADALATRWLFEADHAATDRAIDLLQDAAREKRLAGVLVALERLALHPKLIEIDGAAVADQLLARHPEQALQCCGILLGGSLLSFEEKLALLHRSEALRETLKEPIYDVGLSFLAAEAARRKLSVTQMPALATLIELLDRASQHAHMSNMVLRRAYALDPQTFRLRALANVQAFPRAEPTHFLLAQMLRSGESPESLGDAVRLWLESNGKVLRASFVYRAWLDAKGSIEAVSEPLLAWVETHGQTQEAQFVYTAWLNAKGPIEAVSEPLLAWVETHGRMHEAQFVYAAWLNAKGPIEAVSEPLLAWVEAHGQTPEARFVYSAWLNAKGPITPLAEPVYRWVLNWHRKEEFFYLSKPLSKRHDLPEGVVLAIVQWCTVFPYHKDCLFRLSTLLGHVHEERISTAGATLIVRHVEAILEARTSINLSAIERLQCWLICAALINGPFFELAPFGVIRTIASIVVSGRVFDEHLEQGDLYALDRTPLQIGNFVMLGLRWGMLIVERDHEALWRFARWLSMARVDQDLLERVTGKLGGDSPKGRLFKNNGVDTSF